MIRNFDDAIHVLIVSLEKQAKVLSDVLFEFGKTLNSSDELYELDMRQKQLNELVKLIKKLKELKNEPF